MTKDVRALAGDLGWPVNARRELILVAEAACNGRATPESKPAVCNQRDQRFEAPEPTVSGPIQRGQRWRKNVDTVGVTGSIPVSPTPRRHETTKIKGPDTWRHEFRGRARCSLVADEQHDSEIDIERPAGLSQYGGKVHLARLAAYPQGLVPVWSRWCCARPADGQLSVRWRCRRRGRAAGCGWAIS